MKLALLAKVLKWNKVDSNLLMLGLDNAGKTTILYKMKLGDRIVETIPTIGLNIEKIEYKKLSISCWDVGGCAKIRAIWPLFLNNLDAIIYVVDVYEGDRYRLDEAADELRFIIMEAIKINKNRIHLLVFLNKQDLPIKVPDEEVIAKLQLNDLKLNYKVDYFAQPCCATSGDGLYEGFDWLSRVIEAKHNATARSNTTLQQPPPPQPPFRSPSDTLSNNEFLSDFENCTLPSWDHKTHLRIAYLSLRRYGRREGVAKIRSGLQHFIATSKITHNNRYHETMTYFWLQMVHFAMSSCNIPLKENPSISAAEDVAEFDSFLERNPSLMNGGLFLEYYTRDLMLNNAGARLEFVVPDLQPLPNIVHEA